jgi:hypothetical protein
MHTTRVASGGRYPVLRAVAILFMVGAVGIIIGGIYAAVLAFQLPDSTWGRVGWALVALAGTFFGVLGAVGCAELIKLFIDVEHNTRMAATQGFPAGVSTAMTDTPRIESLTAPSGDGKAMAGGRVGQWLEGEETAEGALLRGH